MVVCYTVLHHRLALNIYSKYFLTSFKFVHTNIRHLSKNYILVDM